MADWAWRIMSIQRVAGKKGWPSQTLQHDEIFHPTAPAWGYVYRFPYESHVPMICVSFFLGLRPHFWHALVWSRTSADLPCLKRSNVGVLKLGESGSWGKSIRYLLDPFTGMVGQTLLDMSGSGILQASPHKHQLNYQEGNQYAVLTATSFELEWWLAKTSPWFCAAWWQCRFLRPLWSKQWLLLPFFLIGSQHIQFWIGFWLPHLCSPLRDKESRIAQPAGPDHLHFARDLPGELWISGPLQRVGLFCWPAKVGSWRSLFGHAECCIRYWVS